MTGDPPPDPAGTAGTAGIPVRVLVADDHAPVRAGVRMALEEGGCVVCADASTAEQAVEAALREEPDVCLIDVRMPGDGIRAAAEIAVRLPRTAVVMLTVSDESDDLFAALHAGASGYLLKDMEPAELVAAVRAAAGGEAPLQGALAARLIEEFRRRGRRTTLATADGRRVELTPREWDVLDGLAGGLSTTQMAEQLAIEPVTVRRHIAALLAKLEVSSRAEAAAAFRRGDRS